MSGEQVNILIGIGQLLFAALVFFRIDAKALKRKGSLADITFEPKRRITRTKVIALLIAGGFAFSGYGFYRTLAQQKNASGERRSDVQQEITRLRATVKRFEDKEAEEAAREWPPLTKEAIPRWEISDPSRRITWDALGDRLACLDMKCRQPSPRVGQAGKVECSSTLCARSR